MPLAFLFYNYYMKYNTTYTPKTDLKETLINIDKIRKSIINFYQKKFKLIEVTAPLHDLEQSEKLLDLNTETRHITFDFGNEYRVGKLYLSHTNWIHELINKTNLTPGEGYCTVFNYLWRDIKENSSISAEREELTIQVLVGDKEDIYEFVEKHTISLYEQFVRIGNQINKNNIDNEIDIFSSQNLANLIPDSSPIEREEKIIQDLDAFILKNPGKKLLSGKRHTYIPPSLYNLNNHYQIFMKDKVNSWPMRVASVSQIATGQEMADQLKVYREAKLLELDFYNKITKSNKKIMEIKINIPRLAMVLLDKGHIGEVQPGTTIKEVDNIKERYKVEIL